jgi:hypothetical protein
VTASAHSCFFSFCWSPGILWSVRSKVTWGQFPPEVHAHSWGTCCSWLLRFWKQLLFWLPIFAFLSFGFPIFSFGFLSLLRTSPSNEQLFTDN